MKKTIASLLIAGLSLTLSPANASTTVKYKNQKAGQFCKSVDLGKTVSTPSGTLVCK
jgi:hypothetical protein